MQVGWLSGPADMIKAVAKAHQFITFTVPSSLQVRWGCRVGAVQQHPALEAARPEHGRAQHAQHSQHKRKHHCVDTT